MLKYKFDSHGERTKTTVNRPFAAKPSRDPLFRKLWAITLKMPEMEKHVEKIIMAKFEASGIKE